MDKLMDAAIQSFLAGIPFLLSHFGVTVLMLVIGVFIYMWITSHDERKLIREGFWGMLRICGGYVWNFFPCKKSMKHQDKNKEERINN